MKQTLITALLLACASMQAQNVSSRHEIGVSYGYPTIAFAMFVDSDPSCPHAEQAFYENDRNFGPLSLEYFYRISRWISVGGVFTYINRQKDIVQEKIQIGDFTERYYALMPSIKFNWVRSKHFGLYSKLVAGPCLHTKTDKVDSSTMIISCGPDYSRTTFIDHCDEYTDRKVGLIGQVTPLGIEAGGRLRVFGELGVGIQGVFNAGLRYQF
jgi:hypothetical protein